MRLTAAVPVIVALSMACGSSGPSRGDTGVTDDGSAATLRCGPIMPFPAPARACASAADCVVVLHQADCCGTMLALGIATVGRARFELDEQACRAGYPQCMCAPRQLQADDGSLLRDAQEVGVGCVGGACVSYRAGCGAPCTGGTSCFDCRDGPQTVYRCSRICTDDRDCSSMAGTRCMSLLGGPFCAPSSCGTP
jgi:hypothetical protein